MFQGEFSFLASSLLPVLWAGDKLGVGHRLDWMILEVFSNLRDSGILWKEFFCLKGWDTKALNLHGSGSALLWAQGNAAEQLKLGQ